MTCCLVPGYEPCPLCVKEAGLHDDQSLRNYRLHCSRARYLYSHSPARRAAIAPVRAMQKPSRNDTHFRIARLVAASHGLSQPCCGYA
jgi:hypothetical protein